MTYESSLPEGLTRNRGLEARLVRDVCVQHNSLSMFVDITSAWCTEGPYECPPGTVAIVKGYTRHDSFNGFTCRVQVPIFDRTEAEQVVTAVATVLKKYVE